MYIRRPCVEPRCRWKVDRSRWVNNPVRKLSQLRHSATRYKARWRLPIKWWLWNSKDVFQQRHIASMSVGQAKTLASTEIPTPVQANIARSNTHTFPRKKGKPIYPNYPKCRYINHPEQEIYKHIAEQYLAKQARKAQHSKKWGRGCGRGRSGYQSGYGQWNADFANANNSTKVTTLHTTRYLANSCFVSIFYIILEKTIIVNRRKVSQSQTKLFKLILTNCFILIALKPIEILGNCHSDHIWLLRFTADYSEKL